MAKIVVDSTVMREKANVLETAAANIQTLYQEMLQEVNTTAGKMKGSAIETSQERFVSMQGAFETIATDIKAYGTFLTQAADSYDAAQSEGTQQAQELGKIF